MSRRAEWQEILDVEVARWSALPINELVAQLREVQAYEVERECKQYQVEVELIEDTANYVHVAVSVDDGSVPKGILPLTHSFIRQKSVTVPARLR
jgi:hypothetical protein